MNRTKEVGIEISDLRIAPLSSLKRGLESKGQVVPFEMHRSRVRNVQIIQ